MKRAIFFLTTMIIPAIFSWWLFVPLALLYVFLAKFPFELVLAALVLDTVYYFGQSFFWQHFLAAFSCSLLILAVLLNQFLKWPRRI